MRDYEELVEALRLEADGFLMDDVPDMLMADSLNSAADAIEELVNLVDKFKWISVEEPPENDRNIFICHGSADFKAPCIGHYDPGMKLFYEDKNWFASPIYDAMFWFEMPKLPLPEPPKEDANV